MQTRARSAAAGLLLSIVASVAAVPALAQASLQPASIPAFPWPGDRIVIGVQGGGCPVPMLDPAKPPRARQVSRSGTSDDYSYVHELEYWMVIPPDQACGVPPPGTFEYRIDLGPLPVGSHLVNVTRFVNGAAVPLHFQLDRVRFSVRERGHIPPEVTGAWYAPEQSGRGLFVAKQGGTIGVWWSTHDADGQPHWVLMVDGNAFGTAEIVGEAFTTTGPPLAPGPAQLETQRWGDLQFRYRGCGRAILEWQADDPAIGEGQLDLVQLMLPDGIPRCGPHPGTPAVPAIWAH